MQQVSKSPRNPASPMASGMAAPPKGNCLVFIYRYFRNPARILLRFYDKKGPSLPIVDGFGSVQGVPALPEGFRDVFISYRIPTGDISLHAVVRGDGPPLLLLPGWQNWYAWRDLMLPLANRYTIVAADPRGLGLSDRPRDGYDTGTLGSDLFGLVSALGHERFAMVGHDCGMWVGYAMAADRPGRTSSNEASAPHQPTFIMVGGF